MLDAETLIEKIEKEKDAFKSEFMSNLAEQAKQIMDFAAKQGFPLGNEKATMSAIALEMAESRFLLNSIVEWVKTLIPDEHRDTVNRIVEYAKKRGKITVDWDSRA